jgi:hypothetical protein
MPSEKSKTGGIQPFVSGSTSRDGSSTVTAGIQITF